MSPQDYLRQLQDLLPRGTAWTREPGANLTQLLQAVADGLYRVHERLVSLMGEADPRTTAELLSEWETSVGLPDDCLTEPQTTSARHDAVVQRLRATGGASAAYFIGLAEALGYATPTIDQTGTHAWRMNLVEDVAVSQFRAGLGTAGDPLRSWGNERLECVIDRLKPAHTSVTYAYGTGS